MCIVFTIVLVYYISLVNAFAFRLENESLAREILKQVKHSLSKKLKIKHHTARILSGGEEGALGWISANYLNNTLKKPYVSA